MRVLRYGATRAQVLGLEAVLGTGSVVSHLGGLVKDNTGYDLPGLVCGSEGTLAVVTAARLRLVPAMPCRTVAVLAFPTVGRRARRGRLRAPTVAPTLEAAELFLAAGLELVCSVTGMPAAVRGLAPGLPPRRGGRPRRPDRGAGRGRVAPSTTWSTWSSRPIRPGGPSCGATARRTPRPSTPSAHPTSST